MENSDISKVNLSILNLLSINIQQVKIRIGDVYWQVTVAIQRWECNIPTSHNVEEYQLKNYVVL